MLVDANLLLFAIDEASPFHRAAAAWLTTPTDRHADDFAPHISRRPRREPLTESVRFQGAERGFGGRDA